MTYKFVSKTAAEIIMLARDAEKILKIIGKDATPTGIITEEQIPGAIQALQKAIAAEASLQAAVNAEAEKRDGDGYDDDGNAASQTVGLKQRAAPLIDMLQRTGAEGYAVIWSR